MPELIGQRITGTSLSERELFGRAIEAINDLRNCYRGIAISRGDERWLVVVRQMDALEDSTRRMMDAKQRPFLIMPR